jgi:hypothetical protein
MKTGSGMTWDQVFSKKKYILHACKIERTQGEQTTTKKFIVFMIES